MAKIESEHPDASGGILVLPFQNLAAHGQDEYLADGLTELLIARLAVAMDQRVISRTTASWANRCFHDWSLGAGLGNNQPAQQDSLATSMLKVCAASLRPSTAVRYGNIVLASSSVVKFAFMAITIV